MGEIKDTSATAQKGFDTVEHTATNPDTGLPVTVHYKVSQELREAGVVPEPLDTVGSPIKPELFENLSGQTSKKEDAEEAT